MACFWPLAARYFEPCYNTVLELTKCMFVIASSKFVLSDRQTNSQSKDTPNKIYSLNNSTFIYNHTVVILIQPSSSLFGFSCFNT
jgi:hypothetical protein